MKLKTVTALVAMSLASSAWSQNQLDDSSVIFTENMGPLLTGKVSSLSQGAKTSSVKFVKSSAQGDSAKSFNSMSPNSKTSQSSQSKAQKVPKKSERESTIRSVEKKLDYKQLDLDKKRNKNSVEKKSQVRSQNPAQAKNSHEFEIFDARAYLMEDLDGDGFYSKFQVEFDADTVFDWADVYARLYISLNGGPWEHYYTTNVFEINGSQSDDEYRVTTTLNENYPTGSYDILVDLYEYGFSGIVATISSVEDGDLYDLPLEDRTQEVQSVSDFSIYSVTTDLLTDFDNDGFYSEFAMALDVDTQFSSADVYVEIYFQNEDGNWELDFTSDNFIIEGDSTLDTQHFEFEWLSGYPTNYYNFKIVVVDAQSNQELAETFSEFSALNRVPLESVSRDNGTTNDNPPPPPGGPGDSSSRGNGGGSWGLGLLLLMFPWIARQRNNLSTKS